MVSVRVSMWGGDRGMTILARMSMAWIPMPISWLRFCDVG